MVSPWLNASGLRGYHGSSEEVTQSPHRPWLGALGTAYVPTLGMLAQVLALWGMLLEVRALAGLAQQLWTHCLGQAFSPHTALFPAFLPSLSTFTVTLINTLTPSPQGKGKKPFIKHTWYLHTYGHVLHNFIYHHNLGTLGVNSYPSPMVLHGKSQRKPYNKISLSPNTRTPDLQRNFIYLLFLYITPAVGGRWWSLNHQTQITLAKPPTPWINADRGDGSVPRSKRPVTGDGVGWVECSGAASKAAGVGPCPAKAKKSPTPASSQDSAPLMKLLKLISSQLIQTHRCQAWVSKPSQALASSDVSSEKATD